MGTLTVVLDACVLYPAPLRDLLMHLALRDLFRARWTDRIHDEWIRAVLRQRPDLTLQQLDRTRHLMNAHVRDCLVRGYEPLIDGLRLPDPDDRHVLAAAVKCGADTLLTFNLKHFPPEVLQPMGIRAAHPDAFVLRLMNADLHGVCAAIRRQRLLLKNPPKSANEVLASLERLLPQTARQLRLHAEQL